MSRILTILEVSQKQAYIFSSNSLSDNIQRSGEIAEITSVDYMQKAVGKTIDIRSHIVYAGGGHAILEFGEREESVMAVRLITGRVLRELPNIELFAASVPFDYSKSPGTNINCLLKALEKKKSLRLSSFHQGSFGIEEIDRTVGKPVMASAASFKLSGKAEEKEPAGFLLTKEFEKLGGSSGDKSFIAIVHIDGNAMGKRVAELTEQFSQGQWEEYKNKMRQFSEGVDRDFKEAYLEMREEIERAIDEADRDETNPLNALSLSEEEGKRYLPVRRIISEGDDICFVAEGRIGVECAVLFLKKLAARNNIVDGKPYAACAGVALIHTKYPFYKAYELAEELCSSAKRFGVTLGTRVCGEEAGKAAGAAVSAIDWHIEYGELRGPLEELRKQYVSRDGICLELRPYIVSGPEQLLKAERVRDYNCFRKLMRSFADKENGYSTGRLKELRSVIRKGSEATKNYLRFHQIETLARDAYQDIYVDVDYAKIKIGSGKGLERRITAETTDKKVRSLLFDAIEMMDLYLPFEQ